MSITLDAPTALCLHIPIEVNFAIALRLHFKSVCGAAPFWWIDSSMANMANSNLIQGQWFWSDQIEIGLRGTYLITVVRDEPTFFFRHKFRETHSPKLLLMLIMSVSGSPTLTGPVTLCPCRLYPSRISMLHSGGVSVKCTGSAVFTLKRGFIKDVTRGKFDWHDNLLGFITFNAASN